MSHGSMADKKLDNMHLYMQLFPEYQYVWVGDSGQGDVIVAKALVASFRAKGLTPPLIFIHDVVRGGRPLLHNRHPPPAVPLALHCAPLFFSRSRARRSLAITRFGACADHGRCGPLHRLH